MIDWIGELRAALTEEYAAKPWIATLATVDAVSRPRARSVVCRKLEQDGSLWVTSDLRSDKNDQLSKRPFGERVFWLRNRFEQFRVAGCIEIEKSSDERRAVVWQSLSDASRAMFLWPAPGTPFTESMALPVSLPPEAPIPEEFTLLILRPDRVEHLDLKPHPHHRRRWDRETAWVPQRLHA